MRCPGASCQKKLVEMTLGHWTLIGPRRLGRDLEKDWKHLQHGSSFRCTWRQGPQRISANGSPRTPLPDAAESLERSAQKLPPRWRNFKPPAADHVPVHFPISAW